MRILIFFLLFALTAHAQDKTPLKTRLLIPAYFYPTKANLPLWQAMADAHDPKAGVELVVIVNFNSGRPPKQVDVNYANVIDMLHKKDVHLLAYVSARYGKTPLADIKNALTQYKKLHPGQFGGVFIDEQNSDAKLLQDYYIPIRQHANDLFANKAKAPEAQGKPVVVTNPGVVCDEAFLKERAVADVVLIHENADTGKTALARQQFPAWLKTYRAERFAVMGHTCDQLPEFVRVSREQGAAYVFATEVNGPPVNANCWETLPKEWKKLLAEVKRVNERK